MTKQLKNYINGEWVEAKSGKTTDVINPADGQVYLQAPHSAAEDVDAAYKAAATAFETWGQTTPSERQLALFRIADAMEAQAEHFAELESQNTGKPRTDWRNWSGDSLELSVEHGGLEIRSCHCCR